MKWPHGKPKRKNKHTNSCCTFCMWCWKCGVSHCHIQASKFQGILWWSMCLSCKTVNVRLSNQRVIAWANNPIWYQQTKVKVLQAIKFDEHLVMLAIHPTYLLRKIGLWSHAFCRISTKVSYSAVLLFNILVFVEGGTKYLSYRLIID